MDQDKEPKEVIINRIKDPLDISTIVYSDTPTLMQDIMWINICQSPWIPGYTQLQNLCNLISSRTNLTYDEALRIPCAELNIVCSKIADHLTLIMPDEVDEESSGSSLSVEDILSDIESMFRKKKNNNPEV
jgi:hypothetical protein